ncbi:Holliday junction branch migration protein RuvA [Aeromicrobium alkaliterrae]|uniref:Holliday junction branch migration complex subunit RuvA n=1 Tax=Aeromicrobium alkaliterrae TaxID=302168 RepID=A0ABP4VJ41_9ACTN
MIASLRGTVAAIQLDGAVLDVSGVGYFVRSTPGTLATLRLGQEATVATTLVVREDSMTLYGFGGPDERDMFELVQTASGVGPKVALAMLSVLDPDRLRSAIAGADYPVLTSVPGIGRKGAERIVVELKDRVGLATTATATGAPAWREQVHEALLGLGWSARDAESAVDTVAADLPADETPDVSLLLRDALRSLARTR